MSPRWRLALLCLASVVALVGSLAVGATTLSGEHWAAALDLSRQGGPSLSGLALSAPPLEGASAHEGAWVRMILLHVRLPRALVAYLVGAALGLSGAALQGLFRNPLADPSVLGVSACSALACQVVIFTGLASAAPSAVPIAATLGAGLATLALVAAVGAAGRGNLETLVLGGVALGNVALAASALLLSLALRDFSIAGRLLQWTLGSLDGRTWLHVLWGLGPVLAAGVWLASKADALDGLLLGDVTAASLGIDVRRTRRHVVLATAVLTGVSVAMGGIVGFVGLMVPHLLRRTFGATHRLLLPAGALGGGLLVVLADVLARRLIAPEELQLGVITAALGAPWFCLLLVQRARRLGAP